MGYNVLEIVNFWRKKRVRVVGSRAVANLAPDGRRWMGRCPFYRGTEPRREVEPIVAEGETILVEVAEAR